MTSDITTAAPPASDAREPRGYTATYALATFGLYLAILTPVMAGLSLKMQGMYPDLDSATLSSRLGTVTGIGALVALLTQPIAGRVSDRTTSRFGMRRPWILLGVLGASAGYLAIGLTGSFVVLAVAWAAVQLFSNIAQSTETATFADQVPAPRRGLVGGIIGMISPLAIVAGSVSMIVLTDDLLRFAVPGGIGLVCGLVFVATLKDRRLTGDVPRFDVKEFVGSFTFDVRAHPDFGWAWLTKALIMFGYASTTTYLTLFLRDIYGMDTQQQSTWITYTNLVSIVFVVITSVVGGGWSDRIGKRRPFVAFAAVVMFVGLVVVALSPFAGHDAGLALLLVGQAFIGVAAGLLFSVDLALCTEVLPDPEDTGKDLGVLNFANTLPQMVAPTLAGIVFIPLGESLSQGFGYTLWFVVSASLSLVAAPLVFKIRSVR